MLLLLMMMMMIIIIICFDAISWAWSYYNNSNKKA